MSFLTDLFEGKTGNLGKDLSNPFDDAGKDFSKQPNWLKDVEIAAPLAIGAVATGGLDLTALPALFGGADAALGAGAAAIDPITGLALDAAVDPLTGLATGAEATGALGDAGVLGQTAADAAAALPQGATLTAGTAPPSFAGAFGEGAQVGGASVDLGGTAPTIAGGGWPTGLDLGAGTAGDVGATAGNPLSLAAPTAAAGASPAGGGGILSSIAGGLKTAAPFVGAAGLGASLYGGYEQKVATDKLNKQEQANVTNAANIASTAQSIAAPLINQGQTLTSYLASGTLPPQFQSQVDQSIATQKAGIIQGYASRGQPTDPTKNSALQQELAAVDNSRAELMTQLESQLSTAGTNMINTANSMLAQGLAATQLEAEIPIQMSKLNEQLNKDMMTSISNFAAAMNGGRNITSQAAA